jgi:hypothetical protein
VLALYSLGAVTGGLAVLAAYLSQTAAITVAIICGVLLLVAIVWLERAPYEAQARKRPVTV